MSMPEIRFTYADYRLLPDDRRCELIEGELHMTPTPSSHHQRVLGRLYKAIDAHVQAKKAGITFFAPIDVILSDTNVVQPDLLVVMAEREGIIAPEGIRGAPDLVAEVLTHPAAGMQRNEESAQLNCPVLEKMEPADLSAGFSRRWSISRSAASAVGLLSSELCPRFRHRQLC